MKRKLWLGGAALVIVAITAFVVARRNGAPAATAKQPTPIAAATPSAPAPASNNGPTAEQFLLEDDPLGTLRLEGRVVSGPDEKPVPGALVALRSQPPRTVVAEDDGSFVFDGLVARQYQVVARSPQGVAGPVNVRLTGTTEPVTLVLRAASTLEVTVTDTAGVAIAGADISLRDIDVQAAVTDARGQASVTPVVEGMYQLVVMANGYARSSRLLRVTGALAQASVQLGKGVSISGTVVSEDGAPVSEARVTYSGASDWGMQGDERYDAVATDAQGRFTMPAMPAGSYRLMARHQAFSPATSQLVTVAGDDVTGVTLTLQAGAMISGVVVDGGDAPIAGARVRLAADVEGAMFEMPRQAYTAADGTFVFKSVARRRHNALAIADAGASEVQAVDTSAGDVGNLKIALSVTGAIAGVVVDTAGEPVEGAQVTVFPDLSTRTSAGFEQIQLRGATREVADVSGRFSVTGLAPGTYQVRAVRSQYAGRERGFGEGQTVEVGNMDVRVVLPPEATVKGKLALADGSAPGPFSVDFGMATEAFANKDGAFELSGLTPRDYKLQFRGAAFDLKIVGATLAAGKTLDLGTISVARGRRLSGRVLQGGVPVAGATVFVGNTLFGSGSSAKAEFGMMTRGMRDTTTNDKGEFSVSGVGLGSVSVLAEHAERGRSLPIELRVGDPREGSLTIDILPFGALIGVVRKDGKVAENVFISAQSVTAPDAMFNVASGPDGTYRFDKLAPDTYKVSAALGMPMTGMQFFSKTVAVKSGGTANLDIEVAKGTLTLTADLSAPSGKVGAALLYLIGGTIAAKNGADLARMSADLPSGYSSFAIYMGKAKTFGELTAGTYTLCAMPYPIDLAPMDTMAYGERHGDDMPVFCKTQAIDANRTVTLSVTPPALLPD